jgi:hypothetical protein
MSLEARVQAIEKFIQEEIKDRRIIDKVESNANEIRNVRTAGEVSDWLVDNTLTVGIDASNRVVVTEGKVDGRDISEDGIVLDDGKTKLTNHVNERDNPHKVTASQTGALPITGGTVNGNISAKNISSTTGSFGGGVGGGGAVNISGHIKIDLKETDSWIGTAWNIGDRYEEPGKLWLHIGGITTDGKRRIVLAGKTVCYGGEGLEVQGDLWVNKRAICEHGWETSSSKDLKSNISQCSLTLAKNIIRKLNPVKYEWKGDTEHQENIGLIAEEVSDILSDREHKTIKMMDLIAALVKVVQDQDEKLQEQQIRIKRLEIDAT